MLLDARGDPVSVWYLRSSHSILFGHSLSSVFEEVEAHLVLTGAAIPFLVLC